MLPLPLPPPPPLHCLSLCLPKSLLSFILQLPPPTAAAAGAETVSLLMSAQGSVLRSEVAGRVVMKAFLSGMPDVKIGLNEKLEVGGGSGGWLGGWVGWGVGWCLPRQDGGRQQHLAFFVQPAPPADPRPCSQSPS